MDVLNEDLKLLGKRITDLGLAWGSSGNISRKISEDRIYVSASGSKLSELMDEEIVECSISDRSFLGEIKPSKEYPMHQEMYRNQKEANFIVHCSPFYTTMVTCCELSVSTDYFVESIHYLRNLGKIEYFHPGTDELSNVVAGASRESSIILMKNHGVILSGKTMDEVVMRLEVLEMTCRMIVEAKQANIELVPVDHIQVEEFKNRDIYKSRNAGKGE